jgi:hypothetical protein
MLTLLLLKDSQLDANLITNQSATGKIFFGSDHQVRLRVRFFPTNLNHSSASAEVDLGRALRYKTESTTVICAFFSTRPTQCLQVDSFGLLAIELMRISLD